MSQLQPMQAQR